MADEKPLPTAGGVDSTQLSARISVIWLAAQEQAARTVNANLVCAYWLIGRELVEEEQGGSSRAGYGKKLLSSISKSLAAWHGRTWSVRTLEYARSFFLAYPELLDQEKSNAMRSILLGDANGKSNAPRSISQAVRKMPTISLAGLLPPTLDQWIPGQLHPSLSWTHYRFLSRIQNRQARDFYETESVSGGWSARQLERQIASLLFERVAKSTDKSGVLRSAHKSNTPQRATDIVRDPYVLEFLDIPEGHQLQESDIEAALIDQMQSFLLELGAGFAFVGRQKRITLDGDHFYPDLVFYHFVLKCFVIVDLKVRKLTHGDLGQMQLYVNFYDREIAGPDDKSSIGIVLCTDKNEAMVEFVLPEGDQQIFASRYQLHLPTEDQFRDELQRELDQIVSRSIDEGQ